MDIRDAAIMVMLRGTGIRRSELVKLELRDFEEQTGEVLVRKGKRGKCRRVYLPLEAISYIQRWLGVRGEEEGCLAIAFAAQKTLEQLLGTCVLYLDRPFIPGEYIRLPSGLFGRVESIGLRSTKIRTAAKSTLISHLAPEHKYLKIRGRRQKAEGRRKEKSHGFTLFGLSQKARRLRTSIS